MAEQPFDDIRALVMGASPPPALGATGEGALDQAAAWIAAWRGRPEVIRPILALYAGAHRGAEGRDDTRVTLEALAAGDAPAAKAARHLGAGLDVFELAIERPVADGAQGPAMSERECAATIAFGMEALAKQPDLLILAGFGAGADEAAAALLVALLGPGAGAASPRGMAAAQRARATAGADPLQLLRQLGGRETAALAGAIIAARTQNTPVLLSGPAALAAGACIAAVSPSAVAHCRAVTAAGADIGVPIFADLGLGLDDGAAGLAAASLVRLACALASD